MGFPTAVRAEPGRAQGCLLNSFLTAHLGSGAAAEHFVSLLGAKQCSGSCVSHPSPASLAVPPHLQHSSSSSRSCLQQLDVAPLPGRAVPGALSPCCALTGIQASLQHHFSTLTVCPVSQKTVTRAWLPEAEDMERLLCLSEPICLLPQ